LKNIVFRLDCNPKSGFGHFYRCLSIAENINKNSYKVFFILNFESKKIANILGNFEIKFFNLKQKLYKNFENDDLKQTLFILKKKIKGKINFLFVDHYDLNLNWQKKISQNVDKLVVINDLVKTKVYCDYFVNFFKNEINKKYFLKKTKFITGFENSIIQKKYFSLKHKKFKKDKIGFFFGATDSKSLTLKTIKKLLKINNSKLEYLIFLGTYNRDKNKIIELTKKNKKFLIYHSKKNNFEFFLRSKFIFCSSGYFNLERIFFRISSSNIYINQNQKSFGNFLVKNKLTENNLSIKEYLKNLIKILNKTKKKNYEKLENNHFEKFIPKIYNIDRLLNFLQINPIRLRYQLATNDHLVFLWRLRNDYLTKKYSLNPGKISFLEHKKWFLKNKQKIFILTNNNEPIGQIRLEKEKNDALIDYAVANNYRNKGYGFMLVKDCLRNNGKIENFKAVVHKKNIASINIFKRLNFKIEEHLKNKNFYLFKKK
tara:strand:- start:16743 stop:18200 length:1458 start_codon:yes stop_codon:yes gene_type:complete